MNDLIKVEGKEVTMTSLELVEFINSQRGPAEAELRHSDFLVKVPKVLGKDERNFSSNYSDSLNRQKPCYRFPKREACLMAMSYSYDLQAKVFDRMTELEGKAVASVRLPDFTNPAIAARAWAEQFEAKQVALTKLEQQSALIEEQQPKVEFHDAVADSINSQSIEEIAKELGTGRNRLFAFLRRTGVLMEGNDNLPYQKYIDAGYFKVIMGKFKDKRGEIRTYTRTLVTGKGAAYIQKQLAKSEVPA